MSIFVIARNGGVEGHSPPLIAIKDRETALVVREFFRASGDHCYELFEVPEWPAAPNKWWNTEPVGDADANPG